jgi:hypothetical protein
MVAMMLMAQRVVISSGAATTGLDEGGTAAVEGVLFMATSMGAQDGGDK